jgi:hypothetical protein
VSWKPELRDASTLRERVISKRHFGVELIRRTKPRLATAPCQGTRQVVLKVPVPGRLRLIRTRAKRESATLRKDTAGFDQPMFCFAQGTASDRVLEKCGFRCEGTVRQQDWFKGAYHDFGCSAASGVGFLVTLSRRASGPWWRNLLQSRTWARRRGHRRFGAVLPATGAPQKPAATAGAVASDSGPAANRLPGAAQKM